MTAAKVQPCVFCANTNLSAQKDSRGYTVIVCLKASHTCGKTQPGVGMHDLVTALSLWHSRMWPQ